MIPTQRLSAALLANCPNENARCGKPTPFSILAAKQLANVAETGSDSAVRTTDVVMQTIVNSCTGPFAKRQVVRCPLKP